MEEGKVLGVGGVFLRADDPQALASWYRDHLGFLVTQAGEPTPGGEWFWAAEGGDTVYSIFPRTSDYFAADRQVMINLRVAGIDALLSRLRAAGIEVITKPEWDHPDVGRFARVHDPEGNPIELWEAGGRPRAGKVLTKTLSYRHLVGPEWRRSFQLLDSSFALWTKCEICQLAGSA